MEGTVSGTPGSTSNEALPSRVDVSLDLSQEELARLEALLAERAAQCRALTVEVERRGELCRELAAQLERLTPAAPSASEGSLAALEQARQQALERALDAEAAHTVVAFERDRALGHLAQVQAAGGAGSEQQSAEHEGQRRGLRSALAEAQEARGVLDARLLLAQQDLEESRKLLAGARREVAEAREQHEGEALQLHAARQRLAETELRAEVADGERAGLVARAQETERALGSLDARHQTARERLARSREDMDALRAELAEIKLAKTALAQMLGDTEGRARSESQRTQDLAAEIAERDHIIARVESDLSLAQVEIEGLRRGVESLDAQREVNRASVELVRQTARHHRVAAEVRVDEARAALGDARETLAELRSVLGALLHGAADALDGPVVSTRSEMETLPGVAIDPQAFEDAEIELGHEPDRRDAEMSEARSRVAALLESLEMERGRLRAVESTLRTLRPLVRDPEVVRRLDELVVLISPSSASD